MASPEYSLEHPPAENLQHSQVKTKSAHRTKRKSSKRSMWLLERKIFTGLCARQRTEVGQFDNRRIDQTTRELERYQISVCALQETKWFGEAVYKMLGEEEGGGALCWQLTDQHYQLQSLDKERRE